MLDDNNQYLNKNENKNNNNANNNMFVKYSNFQTYATIKPHTLYVIEYQRFQRRNTI